MQYDMFMHFGFSLTESYQYQKAYCRSMQSPIAVRDFANDTTNNLRPSQIHWGSVKVILCIGKFRARHHSLAESETEILASNFCCLSGTSSQLWCTIPDLWKELQRPRAFEDSSLYARVWSHHLGLDWYIHTFSNLKDISNLDMVIWGFCDSNKFSDEKLAHVHWLHLLAISWQWSWAAFPSDLWSFFFCQIWERQPCNRSLILHMLVHCGE